jgi:hypothetical protein
MGYRNSGLYEKQERYKTEKLSSRWLGVSFDPEDGSDMFFPNFGSFSTDYMTLHHKIKYSYSSNVCLSCKPVSHTQYNL